MTRLSSTRSILSTLSIALALSVGAGCGDDDGTPDGGFDGGPDVGNPDGGPDVGDPDTGEPDPDGGPPDSGPPDAGPMIDPAVYTMSNDPAGNAIFVYTRDESGALTAADSYATGGMGSGDGLGTQNALVFDSAQNRFFVVNAGDDTVSMLALEDDGTLTLEATASSGGVRPVSITARGNVVYVVNAGNDATPANIFGLRIAGTDLTPIEGADLPASADAVGPGQIEFDDAGETLYLTEKGTNKIDTYTVDADGLASGPVVHPSVGNTPFGFAFNEREQLIVSEAFGGMEGMGAASSYLVGLESTHLSAISSSVPSSQSAPCWVVVVGDTAYITNTASDNLSAYDINADGSLALSWSGPTGDMPIDAIATADGAFLYVLNAADDSFSIFGVNADTGTLTAGTVFGGLPAASVGLAAGPIAVYTLSNAAAGNEVVGYLRATTGALSLLGSYTTGGDGSGAGLGTQGALVADTANDRLFAVNAGDDTISMLTLGLDGSASLASNVSSGGVAPVSITFDGDVVYVVNAGDDATPANIAGFRVTAGALTPIAGSIHPLSADGPGPGQIQFTPDGSALIVTEKGTHKISTYAVNEGVASGPNVHLSVGMTPFGFAFGGGGHLIVSEAFGGMADLGAASSYVIDAAGSLSVVSGSVTTEQTAPCWVAIAGDYAYITNTASANLSAYEVAADGEMTLLWNAETGMGPLDASVTAGGELLYVLNGMDDSFSIYAIDDASGALMEQAEFTGLPEFSVGLVAR